MFCFVWGSFLKVKDNCFTSNNGGNKYRFTTLYSGKDLSNWVDIIILFHKIYGGIRGCFSFSQWWLGRGKGKSRRKSLVLNQFSPSTECFHEIIMLFISWHTKYLKNCKWYFQTVFDFIFVDFADLFLFLKCLRVANRIKKQVNSNSF